MSELGTIESNRSNSSPVFVRDLYWFSEYVLCSSVVVLAVRRVSGWICGRSTIEAGEASKEA